MRILLKFSVAEAALTKKSAEDDFDSDFGETGADFAPGRIKSWDSIGGSSRETLRFSRSENLGMGSELGGGEFVYAGPAQSSEQEKSSLKVETLAFILGILEVFGGAFEGRD